MSFDFNVELRLHETAIVLTVIVLPWGVGVFVLGRSLLGVFL